MNAIYPQGNLVKISRNSTLIALYICNKQVKPFSNQLINIQKELDSSVFIDQSPTSFYINELSTVGEMPIFGVTPH